MFTREELQWYWENTMYGEFHKELELRLKRKKSTLKYNVQVFARTDGGLIKVVGETTLKVFSNFDPIIDEFTNKIKKDFKDVSLYGEKIISFTRTLRKI